jgi:uncharacterized protein (TIGR02757 family)
MELGTALERLYARYNEREYVDPDPLVFLYRYDEVRDREVAGLVASSLAYGNVKQIKRSIDAALSAMGPSPARYLIDGTERMIQRSLSGFRHRWTGEEELAGMLIGIKRALEKFGSLESCFTAGLGNDDQDIIPALTHFVDKVGYNECGGRKLLASPEKKSACKRLNLFLRWMVRSDAVDPGGWTAVSPSLLIVPLDTHMNRIARALGMTGRRQMNLATAREITAAFRKIAPADPVRYDFALTRLGIRRDEDREEWLALFGLEERIVA